MRKDINKMTCQEVWDRIQEVENFEGRTANMAAAKLYKEMEKTVRNLQRVEREVKGVKFFPPEPSKANAMVCVDFAHAALLEGTSKSLLADLISQADAMYVSAVDGNVRLSFSVCDVWG